MQFSERWQNALESIELPSWACSSVGRAPALQAGGRGFESPHVHQPIHQLSGNDSLQLVNICEQNSFEFGDGLARGVRKGAGGKRAQAHGPASRTHRLS